MEKIFCSFEKKTAFTAGEKTVLSCQGSFSDTLNSSLKIEFLEDLHKYSLKILNIQLLSKNKLVLDVTGYKPGVYSNISFTITDGVHVYSAEPLSWTIPSVLEENKNTPYPPYGPWHAPIAYMPVGIALAAGLSLLALAFLQIQKKIRKNKIKQKALQRLNGKTPLKYFIHQMAVFTIRKKYSAVESLQALEKMLNEFLENQFSIPIEHSAQKRIRQIKNEIPRPRQKDIIKIILELEILQKNPERYSQKDRSQLADMVRRWVLDQGCPP